MITQSHNKPQFTVNIGRPSILNEQALKRWNQIHKWVKTSQTPIRVSQAFYHVDRFITRNEFYQGAGYEYVFGFNTSQDRDAFLEAVNEAKKDFSSLT